MKIKKRSVQKKKVAIIAGMLLVVTVAAYLLFAWKNHLPPFPGESKSYQPGEYVTNLDRTNTEKQATQNLIDNPQTKTENNQTDTPSAPSVSQSTGRQTANVLLTSVGVYQGNVSASGFVTNITETGGSCEYVFTNGTSTIQKTADTLANPTSTACKKVSFSANELSPRGIWKVSIRYSSSTSSGESQQKEFSN